MNREIEHQPAYILNRRVYQESSLILDIFTSEHGRLSILAKGALKSKKQWAALLQVFQPLYLSWLGKSTLKTLKRAEAPRGSLALSSDRLYCAYYLNELILNLLHEFDHNPEVFALYVSSLQQLEDGMPIEPILRSFEIHLLSFLGLAPDFNQDSQQQIIRTELKYRYDSKKGFCCLNTEQAQRQNLPSLVFSGEVLEFIELSQFNWVEKLSSEKDYLMLLRDAKRLMRILINHALEGKELKSRTLLQQIHEQKFSGKQL